MIELFRRNDPIVYINFYQDHIDNSVPLLRFYIMEDIFINILMFDKIQQTGYPFNEENMELIFKCKKSLCDDKYILQYSSKDSNILLANSEKGYFRLNIPKEHTEILGIGDHPFVIILKNDNEQVILKNVISLLEQ